MEEGTRILVDFGFLMRLAKQVGKETDPSVKAKLQLELTQWEQLVIKYGLHI